ncbi:hypothetical protein MUP77_04705, partial [Candidatus Bathyarchaeota archaeon]|nr:hypothetical protein [Candidatus Bathyarchaeota archaeon]
LAGVNPIQNDTGNRTGRNLHELRDLFKTQFSKSPAKLMVADYCLGHSIDPLGYDKSFRDEKFFRDEYRKAVPYLEIMSSGRPFHQIDESEVENLRKEVEHLKQLQEPRKQTIELMEQALEDPQIVELLKRKIYTTLSQHR